jgi:hypothetical protein
MDSITNNTYLIQILLTYLQLNDIILLKSYFKDNDCDEKDISIIYIPP